MAIREGRRILIILKIVIQLMLIIEAVFLLATGWPGLIPFTGFMLKAALLNSGYIWILRLSLLIPLLSSIQLYIRVPAGHIFVVVVHGIFALIYFLMARGLIPYESFSASENLPLFPAVYFISLAVIFNIHEKNRRIMSSGKA